MNQTGTAMELDAAPPPTTAEDTKQTSEKKEGFLLLGSPTFTTLENGRLRCVETGHEVPSKDKDSYVLTKSCRLALIDAALSNNKPPLNTFNPHPLSKSKLVCTLTGDTINKTEEHIWKHISGKRFLNKLEQKEVEKLAPTEKVEKHSKKTKKLPKSKIIAGEDEDEQKIEADVHASPEENSMQKSSDSEEPDFWIPPPGDRWDFDDGKDRWEDCTTPGDETNGDASSDEIDEKHEIESAELSMRAKRMSIAVGPSSFASRKKKIKKAASSTQLNHN